MTLSRWIRDYLFFPLNSGLKDRKAQLYASLVGVMGLVGLWHGAGWGYIVWGLMHGCYLVANRVLEGPADRERPWLNRWLWRVPTLVCIMAAWIPFRASTLTQAGTMLYSMFLHPTFGISYSVNFYLITIVWCLYSFAEPYLDAFMQRIKELGGKTLTYGVLNWYVLRPIGYAFLLLLFMAFDDRDIQFIYFQF
jgi:alginate O-acetyltransferase complex protein AlgI